MVAERVPGSVPDVPLDSARPLLEVRALRQHFKVAGRREPKRAIEDVSLSVYRGEILGVVGESGSGKSTIARSVVGLYRPTSGEILLDGEPLPHASRRRSRDQKRRLQMVFQNPASALNPRRTIGHALQLPLHIHQHVRGAAAHQEIARLLSLVELPPEFAGRHPGGLSGGQRQRAAIARALAAHPDLVLLDEPTSALDVSVQAKVIDLLLHLQAQLGLSYMFITHDISLIRTIAHRVVVLYQGQVQELGETARVFASPCHPYTQLLISAVPVLTAEEEALQPKPGAAPAGASARAAEAAAERCAFAPRCPHAMERCWHRQPPLFLTDGVEVRCFLHEHGGSLAVPASAGDDTAPWRRSVSGEMPRRKDQEDRA